MPFTVNEESREDAGSGDDDVDDDDGENFASRDLALFARLKNPDDRINCP